jgi:hypothetical protein
MFLRWLPTFLAFPLGGYLAIETVGPVDGPLTSAVGGLLAGIVIGLAQWLALRSHGLGLRWATQTTAAMAAGSAVAVALAGIADTVAELVVTGLITGAVVGAGQALALRRGLRVGAAWIAFTSLIWGAGWLVSGNVIIDADRGYYSFGASGALLVTAATGLALARVLGRRAAPGQAGTPSRDAALVSAPGR